MIRRRRKVLDHLIAAALLALPLIFISSNFKNPSRVNGFDRVVLAISSPLQSAVGWVVDGVAGLFHRYVWLVNVQDENEELRRENARLRARLEGVMREVKAARDLDGLLELRSRVSAPTIAARVVAVATTPYFRTTRIVVDRGEGEVAAGMPVVSPAGVVGRIQRVYGSYADVILAVDPQSAIDIYAPRTASRGVLRGLGGDNAYSCRIEYMLRSEEVRVDDLVVTSGLGGVFPRDIPVGRVRTIEKSEYGLYQDVEVAPAVDFSHLTAVLVILSPPAPPDPAALMKKTPEPAFGVVPYR